MKLTYTVFAADAVKVTRRVRIDGEEFDATADGLSVQLTHEAQPTITLELTGKDAAAFPGKAGDTVTVTIGGSK